MPSNCGVQILADILGGHYETDTPERKSCARLGIVVITFNAWRGQEGLMFASSCRNAALLITGYNSNHAQ